MKMKNDLTPAQTCGSGCCVAVRHVDCFSGSPFSIFSSFFFEFICARNFALHCKRLLGKLVLGILIGFRWRWCWFNWFTPKFNFSIYSTSDTKHNAFELTTGISRAMSVAFESNSLQTKFHFRLTSPLNAIKQLTHLSPLWIICLAVAVGTTMVMLVCSFSYSLRELHIQNAGEWHQTSLSHFMHFIWCERLHRRRAADEKFPRKLRLRMQTPSTHFNSATICNFDYLIPYHAHRLSNGE